MSESAKTIRANLLKFQPFREKTVTVDAPQEDGTFLAQEVLVRQPTVAARDRILASMQDGNKKNDGQGLAEAQALAVILCCLDPGSRAPIFTDADLATLMESPAGSFVDLLANEAMSLMGAAQSAATKSPS
jgi:hypothetical protein